MEWGLKLVALIIIIIIILILILILILVIIFYFIRSSVDDRVDPGGPTRRPEGPEASAS